MSEVVDVQSAKDAINRAMSLLVQVIDSLEDAKRLAPSRALSVAVTDLETGLLWLAKAVA